MNTEGDQEIGRSVRRSVCVCVCVCVHNSNDVIAPTAQAATPAVTFPSLSPAVKWLFFFPPLSLLYLVVVGVVVFVGVVVVVVMSKSLHLAEICTLMSAF